MTVVQRNFFRLLRSGVFGDNEVVEPMSQWKWLQLYRLSLVHGVTALVWDGVTRHKDDFFMRLPQDLRNAWLATVGEIERTNAQLDMCASELYVTHGHQRLRPIIVKGQAVATLYPKPTHRTGGDIDIFFPYEPQADKADDWARANGNDIDESEDGKLRYAWRSVPVDNLRQPLRLTHPLLNRRLRTIVEQEIRASDSEYAVVNGSRIETLPSTLSLLVAIVRIARYIINDGVTMKQLIDLAVFLRHKGDKVDYVKLQGWIVQLGLRRMAKVEAQLLAILLGFDLDEIQFVEGKADEDVSHIISDILNPNTTADADWYFTQGKNIFVRTNDSGAMMWHLRHSLSRSRYYPMESLPNFFRVFAHSLSHIEE